MQKKSGAAKLQKPRPTGEKVDRVQSPCRVAVKCGGCKWIHKPYHEQLALKEKWVGELLKPFCKTEPIIGMEKPMLGGGPPALFMKNSVNCPIAHYSLTMHSTL